MDRINFAKTCIGSVPHTEPRDIVKYITSHFPEAPFWPQMPKRSFLESMYVQYSSGFPGIVIDPVAQKVHVAAGEAVFADMEKVFQKYLEEDVDHFSVPEEYAAGLYGFMREMSGSKGRTSFVKGHITGPVSFALTVKDASGKAVMYHKEFEELIPKFLGMKARWQVRKLKALNDNVIIFIDEPYVTSIGSSYVSMDRGLVKQYIDEVSQAVRTEGGLTGLHCCGNTEWDFILGTDIDIINLDAFNFMNEFLLYTDAVKRFLSEGKIIAWGLVPTSSDDLAKTNARDIIGKMAGAVSAMEAKGIDGKLIAGQSMVTPACGLGTLPVETADKVFSILDEVSKGLKERYGE